MHFKLFPITVIIMFTIYRIWRNIAMNVMNF
jgi:hypothetical protein